MTLKEALTMGGRSTMDAVQQDIDRVSSGQSPQGLIHALMQLLTVGPAMARLPAVPSYTVNYEFPAGKVPQWGVDAAGKVRILNESEMVPVYYSRPGVVAGRDAIQNYMASSPNSISKTIGTVLKEAGRE